jgi:hypothetical protein
MFDWQHAGTMVALLMIASNCVPIVVIVTRQLRKKISAVVYSRYEVEVLTSENLSFI